MICYPTIFERLAEIDIRVLKIREERVEAGLAALIDVRTDEAELYNTL